MEEDLSKVMKYGSSQSGPMVPLPPIGYLAMSQHIFGCHNSGGAVTASG